MNPRIYLYLCIVLSFLLVGCQEDQPVETTVLRGSIDNYEFLFEHLSRAHTVEEHGLMVGMIDGDDVSIAVIGNNTFTEDTLFQYGSVTKVITAQIIAQLAVEGLIDLNAPLNNYLPESFQSEQWEKVTVIELASHTGGIPRMPSGASESAQFALNFDRDALESAMGSTVVTGSQMVSYSNYGFIILGLVIEEATGLTYAEAVQERIFDPLGMETASIHGWRGDDVAPPLNVNGKPSAVIDFAQAASAGALRGSVLDLLKFLDASLHACTGNDVVAEGACLSQNIDLKPSLSSWGLGWQFMGEEIFGHGGQIDGYQSFVAVSPVKEKAIVIVTNAPSTNLFDGLAAGWVGRDHNASEN